MQPGRTSQLQLSSPNVDHFARSAVRCVVCTVLTHHKIRGPRKPLYLAKGVVSRCKKRRFSALPFGNVVRSTYTFLTKSEKVYSSETFKYNKSGRKTHLGYRVLRNPLAKLANFCPNSHTVRLTEQQSSDLGRISARFKPFVLRGNLSVWAETWRQNWKYVEVLPVNATICSRCCIWCHCCTYCCT